MQIYDLLKKDHREIRELLHELIALQDADDYRFILIEEIRNALIPHSRAEESVFYNTIRAVDADKSLTLHAYREHIEAEALLRALQLKEKANFDWRSTAKKLLVALEKHIEEEENYIFVEARNFFSREEAEMMGDAFEKLKPEFVGGGMVKNALDIVVNMMPPRLSDKLRNFGAHH